MGNPSTALTILQVDDCREHCDLTEIWMRKMQAGCTILSLYSGQEAISYLDGCVHRRTPPDLLLLDWRMPKRSGCDVLQWVRLQPALASLVLIIVSGARFDDDLATAREFGAHDYVLKPQPGGFQNYDMFVQHLLKRARSLVADLSLATAVPATRTPLADRFILASLCDELRIDAASVQSESQEQHVVAARRRVTRRLTEMGWPSKRIADILSCSPRTIQRARK